MQAGESIAIALALLIVLAACAYIIRAKRRGQKCIGCPYASSCGKTGCGCDRDGDGTHTDEHSSSEEE